MHIKKNTVVSIDYTLTNDEGILIDTSKDRGPLSYIHGNGNLVIGLEKELEGKKKGDSFQVSIPPEEGYGPYDEEQISIVPREMFKGVDALEVGMEFQTETDEGLEIIVITGIDGDDITVDGNHPLAGEILNFDINVVDIRQATREELEHGHTHGPDGHHHHH